MLAHNHPSGDPTPSEADIKVTRDLIRAGQFLKIDVLDHVIIGRATPERAKDYASLRELGYFYSCISDFHLKSESGLLEGAMIHPTAIVHPKAKLDTNRPGRPVCRD